MNTAKQLYTVYAIQCLGNGKVFIGSSMHPENVIKNRLSSTRCHVESCKSRNVKPSSDFANDFYKYGENAFVFHFLDANLSIGEAEERKLFWIREYNAYDTRYGYNQRNYFHNKGIKITLGLPENKFEGEHSLAKWERLNKEQKTEVLNAIELLFSAQKGLPGDNFVAMWLQLTAEEKTKVREYADLLKAAREATP